MRSAPALVLSLFAAAAFPAGCGTEDLPPPVQPTEGFFEELADPQTRIVDLTHALNPSNAHWPGPGYQPFSYEIFATIEEDGVLSGRFALAEHTGTHLDAPNHFVEGQRPLDQIPLRQLVVPAAVVDVRRAVEENSDYQLTPEDIAAWEAMYGPIRANTCVLLYTGWDARWDALDSYKNTDREGKMHFPGFSPEVTEFLVNERDVSGLGIDTLSVDYGLSEDFGVHHISHGRGKYHLENVANLGELPATGAWLVVAPIKIQDGTGGPARVFAFVRE